ncbi:MAG: 5'/3'-nucleotidase SurE [Sodalis sp.]|uniref:5'/3'-nucleotidase SurE n=1 Tax=Sodalis sp. (in: enterobacteria) TaxID=1898979 RepID=UPI003872FC56|nr:MAG: 5'/3'-nucleotidase SurE [Sodalis sp.]
MRILLSNDDGIHATGIQHLAVALRQLATVQIVSLDRDRSGSRHPASEVVRQTDPHSRVMLWIGPLVDPLDEWPHTDFEAVSQDHVSLMPTQLDLTANAALLVLSDWLGDTERLAPW